MKKLIATQGIPGSGKTYWAEEERLRLEELGFKVFISNKDDIRRALQVTGWVWSPTAENEVIKIQNENIKGAFLRGTHVVIVADTNFGKHVPRLQGLAFHCKAEFELKSFRMAPLQLCIDRDQKRPESLRVGEQVITDMYQKYILPTDNPYVPDVTKPQALICDLDGTLALMRGRRSPFDWQKVGQDDVNDPVARIVMTFAKSGYTILYVSGRDGSCRPQTELWLSGNKLPFESPHMLLMRAPKDCRKDNIVKRELFDNYIRTQYNVRFVLDDRDQVVKMWRDLGLTCLQVAEGAF